MKNVKELIVRLLSLTALTAVMSTCLMSCSSTQEDEYYDAYFTAMDTQITVRLARDSGQRDGKKTVYFEDAHLEAVAAECADIAKRIESIFSRTDENSLTYEVNGAADTFFLLDEEFCDLTKRAFDISAKTNGAFDITLGTVTELWDITGEAPAVPSDDEISEALTHCGQDKLTLDGTTLTKSDRLTKLDFGAIAKGYALSVITDHLKSTDILYGLVSFGGNVSVFGSKGEESKFKVGITDPSDTSQVVGYVYVDNGYVSVSGDYERYFEADSVRYHHIMDPATGRPCESDISSVSVICNNGALADALSTALFVMGSDAAMEYYSDGPYQFEAVLTLKDGRTLVTGNLESKALFEDTAPEEEGQQ